MSLGDLPVELFLKVATHLRGVDYECLRHTCRGFKWLLPRLKKNYNAFWTEIGPSIGYPDLDRVAHYLYNIPASKYHEDLCRRLWRDGIWNSDDYEFCTKCHKMRPKYKFSESRYYTVEDMTVCNGCYSLVFTDDDLKKRRHNHGICAVCKWVWRSSDLHDHVRTNGKRRAVCHYCHGSNGINCRDYRCTGWPPEYIVEEWKYFFGGQGPVYRCGELDCSRCTELMRSLLPHSVQSNSILGFIRPAKNRS